MSKDEEHTNDLQLTGLARYFNSTTTKGRANVAIATYALLIGYFAYAKLLKKECPKCPDNPTKTRYKNWIKIRGYINHYISDDTIKCVRSASLTSISFLGGFMFYHFIVIDLFVEKDCNCLYQKMDSSQVKPNSLHEQRNEEHENIP